MKPGPSISIALATFNGERYISEQLESLAKQTIQPAELVITDDQSTDKTIEHVAAFAAHAPFPVRVEKNPERLGYRANFFKAAHLCRSEIIAFCDQDDVWLPQKLELCQKAFEPEEVLLAYHNAFVVDPELLPLTTLKTRAAPKLTNPPQSIDPWAFSFGFTQLFRRRLLDFSDLWPQSTDFYNSEILEAHDQWFFFLASSLGVIAYLPNPLALYRQHGSNMYGFGKEQGPSLGDHLRNLQSSDTVGLKTREIAAGNRAAILEKIEASNSGDIALKARQAAIGYRKLATGYKLRQDLYALDTPLPKLLCILSLATQGGYKSRVRWGVGPKAILRDVFRGVLRPHKKRA